MSALEHSSGNLLKVSTAKTDQLPPTLDAYCDHLDSLPKSKSSILPSALITFLITPHLAFS